MLSYEYVIDNTFIDFNGHLNEQGYYHYAVGKLWEISETAGLVALFADLKVGPLVFDTTLSFKKEVFEGQNIVVKCVAIKVPESDKKFVRTIKIFKKEEMELVAELESNCAFLDLVSRKVTAPPTELERKFFTDFAEEL
tara:strand:+ start:45 stop:461 length:417 start_codon:yes stop_codon:yes gene_type:complete